MTKPKVALYAALLFGLFCLLVVGLAAPAKIQWRLRVLQTKWRGASDVSWAYVLAGLIPKTSASKNIDGLLGPVQFAGRDDSSPCPILWETPLGPLWAWELDRPYLNWHTLRWPHLQQLFPEPPNIPPDSVVLEVGAWVGTFAREALNHGARKVIALEPEPSNFVCMEKNFENEIASGRLLLVKAAAWSHDGTERFGHPEFDENGDVQLGGEGFRALPDGDVIVRTVKIDTLVEELGLDSLDLIEMDIEGSERYALQGSRQTLARFSPQIIVCEHHLPDDAEVVPREILAANPAYARYSKDGHGYYRSPLAKPGAGL
jgi:FkbM family methyltransferase